VAAAAAAPTACPEAATGATEGSSGGGTASESLLPLLQRVQQQLACRQQSLAVSGASGSTAAAAAAVHASLLRQQSRQVSTAAPLLSTLSGESFQPDGLGRTMSKITNLTTFNLAERLGLNSVLSAAAAAQPAAAAPQQQQQQVPATAAAEGPYPSYLDADLLELYAEVKKTRKTVSVPLSRELNWIDTSAFAMLPCRCRSRLWCKAREGISCSTSRGVVRPAMLTRWPTVL
jgi:hypothetical protein